MGKIVVTEFVSRFDRGEDGDRFKLDELVEAEAQLLGRVTYEGFAEAWPKMEDEAGFAEKMNSMPKYVVSTTLTDPEWTNSTVLPDLDAVAKVREEVDGVILVAGSAQLVQGLIERDLVDELRMMVFPVVLGEGKRVFGPVSGKKTLKLAESRTVGEGIGVQTYVRAD